MARYQFQVRRLFCSCVNNLLEILQSGCVPSSEILYAPPTWEEALEFVKGRGQWSNLIEGPDSTIFVFYTPTEEVLYELVSYEIPSLELEVLVTVETETEICEVGYFKGRQFALQFLRENFGEPEPINVDEFIWYGRAGDKIFCVAADIL